MQHSAVWKLACLSHCLEHSQNAVSLRMVRQGLGAHPLFKNKTDLRKILSKDINNLLFWVGIDINENNEPYF